MKEITFKITLKQEDLLNEQLLNSGMTAFYFEHDNNDIYLKIYIDKDILPECLNNLLIVSSSDVDESSWSRIWGENYNGHELTDSIFVLPSGAKRPEKEYHTIIEIDPYDSFGDGHHPTTRLCGGLLIHILDEYLNKVNSDCISILDIGTGSGILSIAAWTKGIRDIELFDYDPVAVMKAAVNLKLNGINTLEPFTADIYNYNTEKNFDIIMANLLSRLLEDNLKKIASFLKPGGRLILSGIGNIWADNMKNFFKTCNLKIIEHRILDDWSGFILAVNDIQD